MAESTAARTAGGPDPVDDGAGLTVQDVLGLDLVSDWAPEVAAGAANLGRPVRWLHVAEALDVGVMLVGGEMVLTTGLLLGDERDQAEYIESMHRADVSAVVLGLGRAFRTTPPALRRAAERRGMPLIVLHRPAPFARLTEEVHSRLVHGRFAALDLSDRIRSSLSVLNLAGASLQQLLDETASYSGCPVVMVNVAHRVLAAAGDRGAVSELMRDWDRVSRQVATLADGATATSGPDGWVVAPLEARGRRWGRLVLFGYRGSAEFGCVLANRAAEALTLHRLLGDRDRSWESQTAESLLTDLATGAARPEQLLTRVRAAGLPVNRRTFVPLVVRILGGVGEAGGAGLVGQSGGGPGVGGGGQAGNGQSPSGSGGSGAAGPAPGGHTAGGGYGASHTGTYAGSHAGNHPGSLAGSHIGAHPASAHPEEIPELIGRILAEDALAGLVAPIGGGGIAVLLSLPRDQQVDAVVHRLAVQTHERLATRGWTAVVGVGAECAVLDELPRAFVEAVHVADAAVADPPAGPAARLRDVRLRGLVRLMRDEPELQAFIERELGPLFEHQELLDVLRTYLRTGRNKSVAAQEHHMSRPALYRRLHSIEALLGVDLEDWDQLTSLYVAILAYEAQRASGGGPIT